MTVRNELKSLQDEVGGYIDECRIFNDVVILVNDDGKNLKLPLNKVLLTANGEIFDFIAGTILVLTVCSNEYASLTDELIQKYTEKFQKKYLQIESVT